MSTPAAPLRLDVSELTRRSGGRRAVSLEAALDLKGSAARVEPPLVLDLTLDAISDGIVVTGSISGRWRAQCSEGLEDMAADFELAVRELFETEPVEGETYPLEGDTIDLEQLVRDVVLLELPLAPTCGEPHPEVRASLEDDEPDPRWAPLSQLTTTSRSGAPDAGPEA
jgi:uncharacterized protein